MILRITFCVPGTRQTKVPPLSVWGEVGPGVREVQMLMEGEQCSSLLTTRLVGWEFELRLIVILFEMAVIVHKATSKKYFVSR